VSKTELFHFITFTQLHMGEVGMRVVNRIFFFTFFILMLAPPVRAASDTWLGLVFNVTATGSFFNQSLKSVTVDKAYPGHPGFDAGIREGDIVVEVADTKVEGAKAKDFKNLIRIPVGETVKIKVIHQNGESETVSVASEPRPKKIPD